MGLLRVVRTMTERTVEVVFQVPLLETLLVEDVQALELADFLIAQDVLEADGAGRTV